MIPFDVAAPSTLGFYKRSFTFAHVCQLDEVIETELTRAWEMGMAPRNEPMVIDIDSTICEVSGHNKQKDLNDGAGLEHVPSGQFHANGAWLAHAVLAHNLIREVNYLGKITPQKSMVTARSFRSHFISLAGRLVNRPNKMALRTPARWPGAKAFIKALRILRSLEPVHIWGEPILV